MKKAALEKLAALAEARKARDLAKLEALLAEQRTLEREIAEVAGTQGRDAAEGTMPFAMVAQRSAWVEAQLAFRERRIGAIAIELAGVRAAARVSVGKHEALAKLVASAEAEAQAARDRTEELAAFAAGQRRADA